MERTMFLLTWVALISIGALASGLHVITVTILMFYGVVSAAASYLVARGFRTSKRGKGWKS